MEKYEAVEKTPRKKMLVNNFIGGIAWAVGATVGFAVIVTVLTLIVKNVNFIPYIGNFIAGVIQFIVQKDPSLLGR